MGSSRPRNSSRAAKARSVKRSPTSRRRAAGQQSAPITPRIPAAIEIAIDDQRESIETAISLLYCLHSALRREIEDAGRIESEAVEKVNESADVTHISAMLLVQLDSSHAALNPTELVRAKVDEEALRISELAREMFDSNEREESDV
jgi:hypothetical protein